MKEPAHHNAYAFHVLLHESLRTLGYLGEEEVRSLAHALSEEDLGPEHPATLIAAARRPLSSATSSTPSSAGRPPGAARWRS